MSLCMMRHVSLVIIVTALVMTNECVAQATYRLSLLNSRPNCDLAIWIANRLGPFNTQFRGGYNHGTVGRHDNLYTHTTHQTSRAYEDGSFAPSVTKAITNELEKALSIILGLQISTSLERDDYEQWSWEAWLKISAVFIRSPPDQYGYIGDPIFQVHTTNFSSFATH